MKLCDLMVRQAHHPQRLVVNTVEPNRRTAAVSLFSRHNVGAEQPVSILPSENPDRTDVHCRDDHTYSDSFVGTPSLPLQVGIPCLSAGRCVGIKIQKTFWNYHFNTKKNICVYLQHINLCENIFLYTFALKNDQYLVKIILNIIVYYRRLPVKYK